MDDEFDAPYEPQLVPEGACGPVIKYCLSPTNGRLEWIQAIVCKKHLNEGEEITEEMCKFLLKGDKNEMDTPSLIVHKSLGGKGNEFWNVFLQGRSFDRETYDNEVESTVYYAVQGGGNDAKAKITVRFLFKDAIITRPFKLCYQVELPNGDVIENDLPNV